MDEGGNANAFADEEGADALGTVELVPGKGEKIDIEIADVERDVADRLNGIRMKQDFPLPTESTDFVDWLKAANLVIGMHDGDEDCLIGDSGSDIVGIDSSMRIDWYVRHL